MRTLALVAVTATLALSAGSTSAQQYPIMDKVAAKLIAKYQNATCEQLWEEKQAGQGQPKSPEEQRAIQLLQNDPQMAQAFFAKVSGPIVTKMFQCGMIP
jgi:hypothetical protein